MLNKIGSASQALSKLKEAAGPPCAVHHLANIDLSSRNVRAKWDTRLPLRATLVPMTTTVSLLFTPTSSVPARSWTLSEHLDINLLSRQMWTVDMQEPAILQGALID